MPVTEVECELRNAGCVTKREGERERLLKGISIAFVCYIKTKGPILSIPFNIEEKSFTSESLFNVSQRLACLCPLLFLTKIKYL